jgi:hypothetical protein
MCADARLPCSTLAGPARPASRSPLRRAWRVVRVHPRGGSYHHERRAADAHLVDHPHNRHEQAFSSTWGPLVSSDEADKVGRILLPMSLELPCVKSPGQLIKACEAAGVPPALPIRARQEHCSAADGAHNVLAEPRVGPLAQKRMDSDRVNKRRALDQASGSGKRLYEHSR